MKKTLLGILLIVSACTYEPEVKPSPPYGANGSQCGASYYTNWAWQSSTSFSGDPWGSSRTKIFSGYIKPSSAGSSFLWVHNFFATIRVTNYGRHKILATFTNDPAQQYEIAVGAYRDFTYMWDYSVLGDPGCSQQISDTSMPIEFTFYRMACGSTSGNPYNGNYYSAANLQFISATNGNNFYGLQAFYGDAVSTCTN